MTAWLADAVDAGAEIVTANRRLARHLGTLYGEQQAARGRSVWRTPAIHAWPDWLSRLIDRSGASADLPARISPAQSEILWERALRRQIEDPLVRTAWLVRQMREAWDRLCGWQVPLSECRRAARTADQHLFARAATDYTMLLVQDNWIDDAGSARLAMGLVCAGKVRVPARLVLTGFDRLFPAAADLFDRLRDAGTDVQSCASVVSKPQRHLAAFETEDAELRGAGAWARAVVEADPASRVGIVVTNIAEDPAAVARLVREGAVPGWQYAACTLAGQVNVSLGSRLSDFPAVAVALLALRWLVEDVRTRDVSLLLTSALLGSGVDGGRARLELRLRELPDRYWTPARLLGALSGHGAADDQADWQQRITAFGTTRGRLPRRAPPSAWAELFDATLAGLGWPGPGRLDSDAFQLVNRWRDLLNEFAKLELVSPSMSSRDALRRLSGMAAGTTFQTESARAPIQVLGPLEAAGMQFDDLWVSGLSEANWPPPGRPLSLLAVKLQRRYGMPDAEPADTLDYARRILDRLANCAARVTFSYARSDSHSNDHVVTGLLRSLECSDATGAADPGWHASALREQADPPEVTADPVPPVAATEHLQGGATTLQRQLEEPFSAFAYGRLGVRPLRPIMTGLAKPLRGRLLHDALHRLYEDLPTRDTIAAWTYDERERRSLRAAHTAVAEDRRFADSILRELYDLERGRVARLLQGVVELDANREFAAVAGVELSVDAHIYGASLRLRLDRIDRLLDGTVLLVDYKSGAYKSFLDKQGEPRNIQLVVYANAVEECVSGLALLHVDSRTVTIDGAGAGFDKDDAWVETLDAWSRRLEAAVTKLLAGDVRINGGWPTRRARPLCLLSRINELQHVV